MAGLSEHANSDREGGRVAEGAGVGPGGQGGAEPGSREGVQVRSFDEARPDGVFHFHILRFSKHQIYIWVGFNNSRRQGPIHAAVPTRFEAMPLTSTLVGHSADSDGESMACRLSKKAGCGVLLALGLPPNSPMLQAFAEKRIARELQVMSEI